MSSITVLALNSGETGVDRMKLNASKALTVDGSGVTQPVSGAFYPATQPISAASALLVLWTSQSITTATTEVTTGLDISLYRSFIVYGDTDNLSGEITIEVSFDDTNYYDIGSNLYPDATSGNFVTQLESDAKYVRISKQNDSGSAETISVSIMVKSG